MDVHNLVAYTNSMLVIEKAVSHAILLQRLAIRRNINNVEGMKGDITHTYYYTSMHSTDENEMGNTRRGPTVGANGKYVVKATGADF